ncbi:unnamed protein product [Prorocentrum cordatum]|uniref:PH domain-containing protein n=1 Tax=Prorocentrum cordatum TaxID=2364126 RepID=A0ABN9QAM6_9DINO|nr:unnamed protein product [Polarella glacialis]
MPEEAPAQASAGFFEGRAALAEVAKPEGAWNWALVGPDPEKLPLACGGDGSVDEMRESLLQQAREEDHAQLQFYGLMRLNFGTSEDPKKQRVKYVFMHVSNADSEQTAGKAVTAPQAADPEEPPASRACPPASSRKSMVMTRGLGGVGMRPKMEKAMEQFAHYTTKVEVHEYSDLTLEDIMDKVKKTNVVDGDFISVEALRAALEQFRAKHKKPEEPAPLAAEAPVPDGTEAMPEAPPPPQEEQQQQTRQRKSAKVYKLHALVQVFSSASKLWHDDGVVVQTVSEPCSLDGFQLPAGSMKVQYLNGLRFKWVAPAQSAEMLRPSRRPAPPPTLTGRMLKETHNMITQWHVRHFELKHGWLQWWQNEADIGSGVKPNGALQLVGLQLSREGNSSVFRLRTAASRTVYHFDSTTDEGTDMWTKALNEHAEYLERLRAHLEKSPGGGAEPA